MKKNNNNNNNQKTRRDSLNDCKRQQLLNPGFAQARLALFETRMTHTISGEFPKKVQRQTRCTCIWSLRRAFMNKLMSLLTNVGRQRTAL